ncbi:hypothetical protein [Streptomyces sp. NBC_01240]|uniref:hypothetical protein n=1 Tax=Streptomyces sp. NBC_01240 TaxID=2903793 RepID=UPI002E14FDCD|nr:hypothetical protein OG466_00435 [Streptomyces sp. NBC_01240]
MVERVLRTTPDELVSGYQHIAAGAVHSGVLGSHANTANIVAAIFTATGQDIACVHESGAGQFILERTPDGVHASMTLPGLALGTVGGGTHLPAQRELLETMGCTGRGSAHRLAEIVAGFALALDLSTVSAAIAGHFADAHERLGRSRPIPRPQPGESTATARVMASKASLSCPKPSGDAPPHDSRRVAKYHPVSAASHRHSATTTRNTPLLINRHCHAPTDMKPTDRTRERQR